MRRFRLECLVLPALALAALSAAPAWSAGPGKSYCYKTADSTLRLDVASNGRAGFVLDSWQGGGHACSAAGTATATATGWVYDERLDSGPCTIEILISDGGIRLTDADWRCKASLCGARAVIDGLTFPRSSQVSCASLPVQ